MWKWHAVVWVDALTGKRRLYGIFAERDVAEVTCAGLRAIRPDWTVSIETISPLKADEFATTFDMWDA